MLSLAQFETKDGKPVPGPARLEFLYRQGGAWRTAALEDPDSNEVEVRWFVNYGRNGLINLRAPSTCETTAETGVQCDRTLSMLEKDSIWGSTADVDEFSSHVVELVVSDDGFDPDADPNQRERQPAAEAGWDLWRWVFILRRSGTDECPTSAR